MEACGASDRGSIPRGRIGAMLTLSSPVTQISHIGRSVENQLKHLGILNVRDLLFYFPARWDDLSKITPIREARVGQRAVIRGRIELIESTRSKWRRKLLTQAVVGDETGSARVVWFNQPWIAKMFKPGDELYLVGELKDEKSGAYFSSPAYERAGKKAATHAARIVPIYPSTERLSQKQIRFLVKNALPLARSVRDPLTEDILAEYNLTALAQALTDVHFPPNFERLDRARCRLKFDELLRLQLFAASVKKELKKIPAPRVDFQEETTKKFVGSLPFKLTEDQRKAAWEILQDLARVRPMNRLLEGEVGSGKTVVVAIAALNCALSKGQVAIMAPTEILARQHLKTFSKLLTPHGITVEIRVGSEKRKKGIVNADVAVGTHALIQKAVAFRNLVLAVVDEQHRFGVSQRAALKEKRDDGMMPHLLTLTATPIPRSLALVFYGDLDISVLREMPKGRKKIETVLVADKSLALSDATKLSFERVWSRDQVYDFVRAEVKEGHQIFWTCPIIDPSDILGVKAATEVFEHLRDEVFSDLRVGLLHGRMSAKGGSAAGGKSPRERIMQKFLDREVDILVATPVIEVGIDVPNATVMVIEGAARFGLAQLHQFRGRVGRGEAQAYCLLMVEDTIDKSLALSGATKLSFGRFKAFLESNDGFELAERDLALRGPGEVYSGVAQTGFPDFKIASFADVEIAKQAKAAAHQILAQDPELRSYPQLKAEILEKQGKTHLE